MLVPTVMFIEGRSPIIQGKLFADFLDLCLEHSDFFTLTDHLEREWRGRRTDLLNALMPYCLGAVRTQKWFGYDRPTPTYMDYRDLMIHFYRSAFELRGVITRYIDNVFFQQPDPIYHFIYVQTLEDLMFFKNGRLLVRSTSHEGYIEVFCDDEAFTAGLRSLCSWEEREPHPLELESRKLDNMVNGIYERIKLDAVKNIMER